MSITNPRPANATLLGMARHYLITIESINILISNWCIESCMPLLRTLLESLLGIAHIVQDQHDNRALSYRLARIKRRLKELRSTDMHHTDSDNFKQDLASDIFVPDILSLIPAGRSERAAQIERNLVSDSAFAPILVEWDRLKKPANTPTRNDPNWFTLFGGEKTLRGLAKNVGMVSQYLFTYKQLSDSVHAGTVLDVFADVNDDLTVIRPYRHPGGYHKVYRGVFMLFIVGFDVLLGFYDKKQQGIFRGHMRHNVVPEFNAVVGNMKNHLPQWYTTE